MVRGAMRALTLVSPALSSRWALHLFLSPRRHPRPDRERRLLADATPCDFVWGPFPLRAWSWGEGPAVLLQHGWEGRGAQLGAFVTPLVELGYRVIAYDAPAHGDSPGEQVTPQDIAGAMRALSEQTGGLHAVIAHSAGALATSLALQSGLRTKKVVFVAPGSHPTEVTARLAELLDLPPSVLAGVRQALASRLGTSWHLVEQHDPFAGHAPPLFVAHDVGDLDVPVGEARHIADVWGTSELFTTAGLGHRRILRDPEVVRCAVGFIGPPPEAPPPDWQAFLRMDGAE